MENKLRSIAHAIDDNPMHRLVLEGFFLDLPGLSFTCSNELEGMKMLGHSPDLVLINLNHSTVCARYLMGMVLQEYADLVIIGYSIQPAMGHCDGSDFSSNRVVLMGYDELIGGLSQYMQLLRQGQFPDGECSLVKRVPEIGRLSPKEMDVFCLIGKGMGAPEVAGHIGCGVRTVETHLKKMRDKLPCGNLVEMRQLAWRYTVSSPCHVFNMHMDHQCPHIQNTVGKCPFL